MLFGFCRADPSALRSISKLARDMNSNSIPEGVSVFKYEITSTHLALSYFKISFSFFWNPCFSNLFSVSVLSLVKKVCVKRSSGTVLASPAITLFRSNMKKGVFGRSYFARVGLFLSLISSKLKMAYHLE
jgi:hypothetical protein